MILLEKQTCRWQRNWRGRFQLLPTMSEYINRTCSHNWWHGNAIGPAKQDQLGHEVVCRLFTWRKKECREHYRFQSTHVYFAVANVKITSVILLQVRSYVLKYEKLVTCCSLWVIFCSFRFAYCVLLQQILLFQIFSLSLSRILIDAVNCLNWVGLRCVGSMPVRNQYKELNIVYYIVTKYIPRMVNEENVQVWLRYKMFDRKHSCNEKFGINTIRH